jgi:hypothetical protein
LCVKGACYFDDFIEEAKVNYDKEVRTIFKRFDYLSRGLNLPPEMHKRINLKSVDAVCREIKTKHLRVIIISIKI